MAGRSHVGHFSRMWMVVFDHVCRGSHPGLSPLRWAKIQINLTKKYVNIPSEKYIYVHKYVYICVYTYLCKMDEYRSYNGLS